MQTVRARTSAPPSTDFAGLADKARDTATRANCTLEYIDSLAQAVVMCLEEHDRAVGDWAKLTGGPVPEGYPSLASSLLHLIMDQAVTARRELEELEMAAMAASRKPA